MTVPNHILLLALDWKHRYGAASLEMALNRIAAHIEQEESDDAIEWTQVATVIAQGFVDVESVAQPTPL